MYPTAYFKALWEENLPTLKRLIFSDTLTTEGPQNLVKDMPASAGLPQHHRRPGHGLNVNL